MSSQTIKPVDQAVAWVQQQVGRGVWKGHLSEVGCLFWLDRDGTVTPGTLVDDGKPDSVRLYQGPEDRRRALVGMKSDVWPKLAGEFHLHPAKYSAVGYLPSPDDVLPEHGACVASDRWWLDSPFNTDVRLSPGFQIILLLPFGLLWVVEKDAARSEYDNFTVQQSDLTSRARLYRQWHRAADIRLGSLSPSISQDDARRILGNEQSGIQQHLFGRCTVRLV
jgi:hypothetical protein